MQVRTTRPTLTMGVVWLVGALCAGVGLYLQWFDGNIAALIALSALTIGMELRAIGMRTQRDRAN